MLKSHNEVMVVNTKIKNHNYSYKIEYSVTDSALGPI